MTEPEVKIIADSICKQTYARLTTFEVRYWRPLLPEMNTHRVFSRNAASSRAQSFSKRCDLVRIDPIFPSHWNAEQKGMVGGEEFSDDVKKIINEDIHKLARATANYLEELNSKIERITGKSIHKQYLNRYLEPFCSTTQLISSTEWDNFFDLRCADDAQPEIKDVADKMKALLNEHHPHVIPVGEWHLPYITIAEQQMYNLETLRMMSVARCARVSYKAYDGKYNLEGDIRLYNQLLNNGHYSPFEHVAQAIADIRENCANFIGWRQLRKDVE
nr:MAG TPA: Thymidylate synthase complementing protein [Caudoviricetes sp.]